MTDINPSPSWAAVRQLETNEFATGGANGNMNEQAKSLAARSELLKQYTALPYESKTSGYALNERVQLATGDIVRSTIASNVNNPNENMTGWVNVAAWSSIESKPTTVAGYGITDAYTKTEADTLFVEASQIGQPNGVAGLDALGKLDSSKFPLATETALGVAKIATTAIAQAGTNDADFLTAKKLRDALNATGDAPVLAVRAKATFNGVGGVAGLVAHNIASITRTGLGVYNVVFINPMPNNEYIVVGSVGRRTASSGSGNLQIQFGTTPTINGFTAVTLAYDNPNDYALVSFGVL